ncbi:MAG: hypothetical protein ACYDH4_10640 [Candidatus Cryosericum sp.]
MHFAIVNETTDAQITQTILVSIAEALAVQSQQDVATWWETTPDEFDIYPSVAQVPLNTQSVNYSIFHLVDNIPEAPDALAYHTVDSVGRPVLKLGWNATKAAGGTLTTGSVSLSCAMSHEAVETKCNPFVNKWVDMADGITEVCHEACDPVEGDSYAIDGIAMSNFVGPRWFSGAAGPYDKLGVCKAPFTLSSNGNGYMVQRTGGPAGQTNEVFGDKVTPERRAAIQSYGRVRALGGIGWAIDTQPGT